MASPKMIYRPVQRRAPIRCGNLLLLVCLGIGVVLYPRLARGTSHTCPGVTVGLDTTLANEHGGPRLGEAIGQVFLAGDTLISSLTVWRWAYEDTNVFGWHLYIAGTDSLGRPAPDSILLDGPTIYNPFGDGIHAIPFRFVFEPPFALPARGKYEFAIQSNPCDGFFEMLANHDNAYIDGSMWLHGRTVFSGCNLRNYPNELPGIYDLIFEIEFCSTVTPARPETWGRLRAIYR